MHVYEIETLDTHVDRCHAAAEILGVVSALALRWNWKQDVRGPEDSGMWASGCIESGGSGLGILRVKRVDTEHIRPHCADDPPQKKKSEELI